MKLRNLTGAVRKTEGPVFVDLNTSSGVLRVPLQKTGLLTALKDLPLDAQDETEMSIDDAGVLTWRATSRSDVTGCSPTMFDEQIDIEELTTAGMAAFIRGNSPLATAAEPLISLDDELTRLLG